MADRDDSELLATLVALSPLGLVVFELSGHVALWNAAAHRIFGWSPEQVLGRPLPVAGDARWDGLLRKLRERGESSQAVEVSLRRRDGSSTDALVWTAPLGTSRHQTAVFVLDRPSRPAARSNTARVLVVEDNRINQQVVSVILEKLGCSVEIVGDGKEAVAVVTSRTFEMVLMDCLLPVMDGFAATAAIRAHEASHGGHTVIVATTANAMKGDRERCLASGMDDYISKPIRPHDLGDLLDRWVPGAGPASKALDIEVRVGVSELERAMGKKGAAEVFALFLADAPKHLDSLRASAADVRIRSARALEEICQAVGLTSLARASRAAGVAAVGAEAERAIREVTERFNAIAERLRHHLRASR
ncbi:MAG: response regulator [Myxococcales bacterium]